MIKNVVLDMGNVLLDFRPEYVMDQFCSSEEERDVIRRELFEGPEWSLGDRGDIKDKDRYDLVKVRVPEKYHEALKNCALHWDICMDPLEGAKEFCEKVKEKGYKIFVLSNASDLFYVYFPKFHLYSSPKCSRNSRRLPTYPVSWSVSLFQSQNTPLLYFIVAEKMIAKPTIRPATRTAVPAVSRDAFPSCSAAN